MPWVIARVGESRCAIPSAWVSELIVLPHVAAVPNVGEHVRGLAVSRDRTIVVLDLRSRFGVETLAAEHDALIALMQQREADHRRWLDELQASVAESRPFELATDPSRCAFGRWYDHYHSPNPVLARHLARFDAPHRAIHALAGTVDACLRRGARAEGLALIEQARTTTLAYLLRLFADVPTVLRDSLREILVVHEHEGRRLGLAVDAIDSVRGIDPATVERLDAGMGCDCADPLIVATAQDAAESSILLLLDEDELTREHGRLVAA
ncbi:MAG TPA: chemotaxis protein CheW [Gemmatimonadaceae bacterium]|nr:chemotaxis protein CheW [Gemmatimonadaceae bacterium]